MTTDRNTLVRALAEIDGVILEARSHVEKPDQSEPQEQVRSAKVPEDLEAVREGVEGELRGE